MLLITVYTVYLFLLFEMYIHRCRAHVRLTEYPEFSSSLSNKFSPRPNLRRNSAFGITSEATLRYFFCKTLHKELCGLGIVQ